MASISGGGGQDFVGDAGDELGLAGEDDLQGPALWVKTLRIKPDELIGNLNPCRVLMSDRNVIELAVFIEREGAPVCQRGNDRVAHSPGGLVKVERSVEEISDAGQDFKTGGGILLGTDELGVGDGGSCQVGQDAGVVEFFRREAMRNAVIENQGGGDGMIDVDGECAHGGDAFRDQLFGAAFEARMAVQVIQQNRAI